MPNPPVVFVPGLGGSFNLQVLLDWRGPTLGGWNFPPFVDYGKTFLDAFQKAGYRRNRDLFVAFYDWRKSVPDCVSFYLIPWIDRARKNSGSDKVILIGHSMGGLVSRSYIQSNGYRGDVDQLFTLGTPQRGSANAYYPWGGGEIRWDSLATTVIDVYLWYLQRIHPFQTGLDRLKTIRALVPSIRDLLPIDDYLVDQGPPQLPKPEDLMHLRNMWGDIINGPDGLESLLGQVAVTTINGVGFTTLQSIVVSDPPPPTDDPPRYPDGTPVEEQTTGNGDGTVLLSHARIDDERANNLPPVHVAHAQLPDETAVQILTELNVTPPAVPRARPATPRLVIMTASPLEVTVEPPPVEPAAPAGILGAPETAAPPRRRPPVRARNYGHQGKPLNMIVIPEPAMGDYNVHLHGTATGWFELGALMIGVETAMPGVLGVAEGAEGVPEQPTPTSITTVHGDVAAETQLYYTVTCTSTTEAPQVTFNARATAHNALTRLSEAVRTPLPPGVLGAAEGAVPSAQVQGVLSAADVPEALRTQLGAALVEGDATATQEMASLLSSAERPPEAVRLLDRMAEQVVSLSDKSLALGLAEQIKQLAQQS